LFILSGGILLFLALVVLGLSLLAERLAGTIPFAMERELIPANEFSDDPKHRTRQQYLQALAMRLGTHMRLPPGMSLQIHYQDEDTVNAYATLGGNIVIYRGLWDRLPDENALAMVLAHEIAHIEHRDPIISLGRGVVIALAIASLAGISNSQTLAGLAGNVTSLTLLKFSRDQEARADRDALAAVQAEYGSVSGATALFRLFDQLQRQRGRETPALFDTHPHNVDRLAVVQALARQHGWPLTGPSRPLPGSG